MSEPKVKRKYNMNVQTFGKEVTIYDMPSLVGIVQPGFEMTPKEADSKFKSRIDLLQDCYEKDPIKTTEYMVRKGALLLNHAYESYRVMLLEKGMNEKDSGNVSKTLEEWKGLKDHIAAADRIIFDERPIPSCIIDFSDVGRNLTYVEELEKHLESLKKK
ncbi:MAG: hypothetical protein V1678_04650 [Candidatus Aenigmatarchaeota archaeon]